MKAVPLLTCWSVAQPLPLRLRKAHPSFGRVCFMSTMAKARAQVISFVGAGNMASAIIGGLLGTGVSPANIRASAPHRETLSALPLPSDQLHTNNKDAVRGSDIVFLCVKPNIALSVLEEIALDLAAAPHPALVSIVGGLKTTALEKKLKSVVDSPVPVIRVMPNTPAMVNAACFGICGGTSVEEATMDSVCKVLETIGIVERIPEYQFGALTAISGCGVAYAFMMMEALADAGVRHGLQRETAKRLAAQTVAGAGILARKQENTHPAVLRNRVESPGGITVTATAALERAGFRGALLDAVDAAVDMNKSMGDK